MQHKALNLQHCSNKKEKAPLLDLSGQWYREAEISWRHLVFRVESRGTPSFSIHLFLLLIYDVFSLGFLPVFSWPWAMSWSWIFWAGQLAHVLGAHSHSHASRVAACKPVPENGLPGCQHNTQLLKYLNIGSLLRLPCNYTCSFGIPPRFERACAR